MAQINNHCQSICQRHPACPVTLLTTTTTALATAAATLPSPPSRAVAVVAAPTCCTCSKTCSGCWAAGARCGWGTTRGSPTVFNLATHRPEAVAGVASLCVPFNSLERGRPRGASTLCWHRLQTVRCARPHLCSGVSPCCVT